MSDDDGGADQLTAAAAPPVARGVVVLVATASAVVIVAGLRGASGLIAPLFLALVLTIAVHPVQTFARQRGWPGWCGAALGLVTVYVVLVGFSLAVVVSLARFASLLPEYAEEAQDAVQDLTGWLGSLGVDAEERQRMVDAFDLGKLSDFVLDILGSLASLSSSLFFLLALLLFMAIDGSSLPSRMRELVPGHGPLMEALTLFATGTRSYLVVSSIFGLIVAMIDTVALAICGVPAPFLWGLLAFITNYIPNIGFIIGLVPPAVLALFEGGPSLMLAVIVIYCGVNFVIQSVIQPKFVGDAVGLGGTLTFLSLVFWTWVLGPLGALLAIPLTLLAKALLIDADPGSRWILLLVAGSAASGRRSA